MLPDPLSIELQIWPEESVLARELEIGEDDLADGHRRLSLVQLIDELTESFVRCVIVWILWQNHCHKRRGALTSEDDRTGDVKTTVYLRLEHLGMYLLAAAGDDDLLLSTDQMKVAVPINATDIPRS